MMAPTSALNQLRPFDRRAIRRFMSHDQRAIVASNNNADLYEAVFAAWGLRYERTPFAFVAHDAPPPYYSHVTVLAPGSADQVLHHVRAAAQRFGSPVSFKDSFCEFGADGRPFTCLFEASWLWRAPDEAAQAKGWVTVEDADDLAAWEESWKHGGSPTPERMFRPALLGSAEIAFLGKKQAGRFVAGCIANRSRDCAGLSNVFSVTDDENAFHEAVAAVAFLHPRLPIAGYAADPRLEAATKSGFETTGALRVLEAREQLF